MTHQKQLALWITSLFVSVGHAATPTNTSLLSIDASGVNVPVSSQHLHMGSALAPNGERLAINNQFLLKGGHPWLPVMGEFHYSRSPASSWEAELQKMKSAGVNIVASYVIWSHHEEHEGQFNWKENRDLHRFIALCQKVGLKVVVRIGPWSHAEVRFGGFPDWVVNAMPTRGDDPQYLHYVERLYAQIGEQLKGQLWKQGGPVIGVQLENEYNLNGPQQGAQHIRTLKALALKAGLDVPMYTVTGWDNTIYPQGEVVPVFGGYPDEPWGVSTTELPPKETYAFRFDSRVSGDLGAQTVATSPGTAEADAQLTPFLGAEYGAGLPAMYRRRTVVSADDIASMLPVQLGSGVNLLGYYMFHGGRNPMTNAGTSMQESSMSGGYNDTPMISYDFQAPLGPDGQQRDVLRFLRPYHYFLHDFGALLAPMRVRKPDQVPTNETDLHPLRWSVRSQGDQGFLFVNNHVRQYATAAHQQVRFSVKLNTETIAFPETPVTIDEGRYFIWPLNLDLDGTTLRYATAKVIARLDHGTQGITYVFAASGTIPVELGFHASDAASIKVHGGALSQSNGHLTVDHIQPGSNVALTIQRPHAAPVQIVILTEQQSQHLTIGELQGQRRLIITDQQSYLTQTGLALRATNDNHFHVEVFPALHLNEVHADTPLHERPHQGIFQVIEAEQAAVELPMTARLTREAKPVAPVMIGGIAKAALEPKPESFSSAATWQLDLPTAQLQKAFASPGVADVLLSIDFVGDIGRLFSGVRLLDDWYYSGYGWQIGLRQYASTLTTPSTVAASPLRLSVLPLRADAPIYLPKESRPDFAGAAQIAALRQVKLIPVYQLSISSKTKTK